MRLIDADKIVIPKGFFEDMNTPKLLNWLNSQPTINQWISVEERMPEPDTSVLVSVPDYDSSRRILVAMYDDFWGWRGQWDGAISMRTQITHWMPLPEPPKEE